MAYAQKVDEIKELRDRIKFSPEGAYLFWGEEEYLKRHYLGELRRIIEDEGMEDFNRTVLDFERDDGMNDLEDAVSTLPVMAEHKLVEVYGMSLLSLKKEDEKRLIDAVKRVADGIILVIFCRDSELDLKPKKNSERKVVKDLRASLMIVEFPRQSENKLLSWCDKIFSSCEVRISDVNLTRMIKLCDYSMTRLKSESDKLISSCKFYNLHTVPNEMIDLHVRATAENETYEFTEAIIRRSKKEAFAILENLRSRNVEPIVLVSVISKAVTLLLTLVSAKGKSPEELSRITGCFDWQIKRYLPSVSLWSFEELTRAAELVLQCDRELKSIATPPYVLVEALLVNIMGDGR